MPHSDMARILPSNFDPSLSLHAAPERMFHQSHLSHQVGYLDECIGCVPASHDHMGHGGLGLESCNDFVERKIVVAQDDVEFIGNYHFIPWISDHQLDLLPSPASLTINPRAHLRFPPKTPPQ